MKKISIIWNSLQILFCIIVFNVVYLSTCITIQSKVLYEYGDKSINVTSDTNDIVDSIKNESTYTMQILLDYPKYDDSIFKKIKCENESYLNCSKKYHLLQNRKFLKELDIEKNDCFVSEYTPFIFMNYSENKSFDDVRIIANKIANYEFVESVRVFNPDIYKLDLTSMEKNEIGTSVVTEKSVLSSPPSNIDMRTTQYDNFPSQTYYKGRNIKIGILDTGIFRTNHFNFTDVISECVYDSYNEVGETEHPTMVASVLGGKFGYASLASLYYVDVNSDVGYVGIERLINKGCNIVNMSISARSCENNGEYDTGLEAYLDYIYDSTRIIMVAAAGNYLNEEGSGGFVTLPALCANVISVGSITSDGVPSDFSSYRIKNVVESNPNLVAVGSNRYISSDYRSVSGTSFSSPAVSGAIALFFEKNGIKELPEVLAVLSATANDSIIDKTIKNINMFRLDENGRWVSNGNTIVCSNNLKSNGTRERTGAGALDVTALLNYENYGLNGEVYLEPNSNIGLRQDYFFEGQTIKISCAWQRNASLTVEKNFWGFEIGRTYSLEPIVDVDLCLYDTKGNVISRCYSVLANVEVLTTTISKSGNYEIRLQTFSNCKDLHNLNYAYVKI